MKRLNCWENVYYLMSRQFNHLGHTKSNIQGESIKLWKNF